MLHILFLTHWYPSRRNPVEGIFVQEHAIAVSMHHKVTVIHVVGIDQNFPNQIIEESDSSHNIALYHLAYPKPTLPKTAWLKRLQTVDRAYNQIKSAPNPPDLIHAHVYSSADLAVYLSKKYHLPTVLSEHASSYPRNLFTRTQAFKAHFFLNQINLIMPVSKALEVYMRRFDIRGPYEIVPNTVDTTLFYPPANRTNRGQSNIQLLQVASLNQNKAVHDLIRAIPIVLEQFSGLKVIIIGEGPERTNLESLSQSLGLTEQIRFLGIQNKAQVADWMRSSDCLVLTSHWENQPVVLLEALACGLPVIATNVGGIPEIVNSENGILVPPNDPIPLAKGIIQVCTSPGNFNSDKISESIHRQYSYQAIASKFDNCYQRVLMANQR